MAWVASIPWEYPDDALAELARARGDGALGVATLANMRGPRLIDPLFEPVWSEIGRQGLPVFVHPTIPPGGKDMRLDEFGLATPVGFMVDTTLAFTRLILSGFLDRYPNVKLIAPHGGGTLPYLCGRLDRCYETIPACRAAIKAPPSTYLRRISTTPSSTKSPGAGDVRRGRWRRQRALRHGLSAQRRRHERHPGFGTRIAERYGAEGRRQKRQADFQDSVLHELDA